MSGRYINSSSAYTGGATGTSLATAALSVSAGNTLIVCTHYYGSNAGAPTISDTAGHVYSICGVIQNTNSHYCSYHICSNIKTLASNVVTATWGSAVAYRSVFQLQYSGLFIHDAAYNPAPTYRVESSGIINSPSATTSYNSSIVIGNYFDGSSATYTAAEGNALLVGIAGGSGASDKDIPIAGSGSYTSITNSGAASYAAFSKAFLGERVFSPFPMLRLR
jgi:hypothetical protein